MDAPLRTAALAALLALAGCRSTPPTDPRATHAAALARVESWDQAAALWTEVYAQSGGTDIDAGLQGATALLEAERPAEARALLVELASRAPDSAVVFESLGRAHEDLGRPAEALANFRTAAELDPRNAYALQRFGDLAFEAGEGAVGLDALERSVGLDPASERARVRLGLRLLEAGRTERALHFLDGVLEGRHATDEERRMAAAYVGPNAAAVAWLRPIVQRDPNDAEAQRLLGDALLASGRLGEAVAALEAAARSEPSDVEHLLALAGALHVTGNDARALAVLEHAAALELSDDERAAVYDARATIEGM